MGGPAGDADHCRLTGEHRGQAQCQDQRQRVAQPAGVPWLRDRREALRHRRARLRRHREGVSSDRVQRRLRPRDHARPKTPGPRQPVDGTVPRDRLQPGRGHRGRARLDGQRGLRRLVI